MQGTSAAFHGSNRQIPVANRAYSAMELLSRMTCGEAASSHCDFLAYGGAVGALLQNGALTGSPLGAPGQWPDSLKTLMTTVFPVQAQIVVFWGPDYVALYNDAYAPTIGNKHPAALGRGP